MLAGFGAAGAGGGAGAFEIPLHDGVDGWVEPFDAVDEVLQCLARRHLAAADRGGQIGRRPPVQIGRHGDRPYVSVSRSARHGATERDVDVTVGVWDCSGGSWWG